MSRTRTRDDFHGLSQFGLETYTGSCSSYGWQSPVWYDAPLGSGTKEIMHDVVTPAFHKKSREGRVIINPMSHYVYKQSFVQGGQAWWKRSTRFCTSPSRYMEDRTVGMTIAGIIGSTGNCEGGVLDIPSGIDDITFNAARTEAATECLSKRGRGGSNLYESLAEYKQTRQLAGSLAESLENFASGKLQKMIAAGASLWLIWRYGIKPLISDVQQVAEALQAEAKIRRETTRVMTGVTGTKTDEFYATSFSGSHSPLVTRVTQDSVTFRAMSLDEYVDTQMLRAGLSLKNLLTVPLELITLSFVVEWFVNIQAVFGAIAPSPSFRQLGSCLVMERHQECTYTVMGGVPKPTYTMLEYSSGTGVISRHTKARSVGLPAPGVVLRSNFKFDALHLTRIADASALIVATLTRSKIRDR